MTNACKKIMEEICTVKYHFLSKDWIIMLEKNNKTRFIYGYKFDLNLQGTGQIADDKYALYDVLKYKNIPVVEHKIVYSKTNNLDYAKGCNTLEYVKEFFIKNNNHIVLKANIGSCGRNVYNIQSLEEIEPKLDTLFRKFDSISMCPFYKINCEYRIVILNKEVKALYAKYLPKVIGNGKNTIKELLIKFNPHYFKDNLEDKKYNQILSKNEEFEYNWKFNLSQGSIIKEVQNEELKIKLMSIAKKVADSINLKFGSIDIIETEEHELLVLEVNSGVMFDNYVELKKNGYDEVKQIYKEAIISLFNDK